MSDAMVTVGFSPARSMTESTGAYTLSGGVVLPKSKVELELDDHGKAITATMPEWLARDRGLTGMPSGVRDTEMTREDWFLLGLTMALLSAGHAMRDATWEARKLVRELIGSDE